MNREHNWLRDHLDHGTVCLDMGEFEEYRSDGWPLCPKCGEDELQNQHVMPSHLDPNRKPELADFIQSGLKCLACHWESREWKKNYR